MTPLHYLGDFLRNALLQIPLGLVQLIFIAVPALLLIWVLRRPPDGQSNAPDSETPVDLRPWAALALGCQVLIYLLL